MKQPRIVMIDNFDSFTYLLVDYLKQTRADVTVYTNRTAIKTIQRAKPDLIVLSPGPGQPVAAGYLCEYIEYFKNTVPLFGVCLGMQAMIEVSGGSLRRLPQPVHGKASVITHAQTGVFTDIPSPCTVGRYHSLAAAMVPASLTVTAQCTDPGNGDVVMAIQHATLPMCGVQFHPESVLTPADSVGLPLLENVIKVSL